MKLIRNFTTLTILLLINFILSEKENSKTISQTQTNFQIKTTFQSLLKNLKSKTFTINELKIPDNYRKLRREFKFQLKSVQSDRDRKCLPTDVNCAYDYKIYNAAFKIYRTIHDILHIKGGPVIYDAEVRNRIGKASTFVMNEIGLGGVYTKGFSAMYR